MSLGRALTPTYRLLPPHLSLASSSVALRDRPQPHLQHIQVHTSYAANTHTVDCSGADVGLRLDFFTPSRSTTIQHRPAWTSTACGIRSATCPCMISRQACARFRMVCSALADKAIDLTIDTAVMNFTEMEAKVREATNNEPWGTSSTQMQEIASATFN